MTGEPPRGRVLVCRTDAICDLVLTTPIFEALHSLWPDVELHVLVSARTEPILQNNPFLHKVHVDPNDSRALISLLKYYQFSAAVAVKPYPRLAWSLLAAGIARRIGPSRRYYSRLFNERVTLRKRQGDRHEAEYNLDLLKPFGWSGEPPPARVFVGEEDTRQASELLMAEGLGPKHPYVVVHPGSRGSAPNLSYRTYATVVSQLTRHAPVVLTGSEEEVAPLLELLGLSDEGGLGVFNLAGKTTIRALIGLLAGAECVVASSTGPLHLAAAAGTRVVSYFGHYSPVSARRWRPWAPKANYTLVNPPKDACPSTCKGNCGRDGCLLHVKAADVVKAVLP